MTRPWLLVDDRGRVVSRHATEAAAWRAADRREQRIARMSNRPGMQGGGYGQIAHGVTHASKEHGP